MIKKNNPVKKEDHHKHIHEPVLKPPVETDEPVIEDEKDPDVIPDEDPYETPPYEKPEPGEGP